MEFCPSTHTKIEREEITRLGWLNDLWRSNCDLSRNSFLPSLDRLKSPLQDDALTAATTAAEDQTAMAISRLLFATKTNVFTSVAQSAELV